MAGLVAAHYRATKLALAARLVDCWNRIVRVRCGGHSSPHRDAAAALRAIHTTETVVGLTATPFATRQAGFLFSNLNCQRWKMNTLTLGAYFYGFFISILGWS